MRIITTKKLKTLALVFLATVSFQTKAATLMENFDNPSTAATTNNGVAITYNSGTWFSYGITKPTTATENDRINGLYSIRMRGLDAKNSLYMQFDKAGAGTLSFVYGAYANHSDGEFTIQKSTDGGTTWTTIGTPVTVPKWSGTFLTYSLPVNYNGNIRFKIVSTLRSPNNPNQQFNIDDVMITDYGTEQVAAPVSSVTTGAYTQSQLVSLSSETSGATIYYTTDGSTPTTASAVYSTPITVSSTSTVKAIAVKSGLTDSRIQTVLISFPTEVSTIAELVSKMASSGTNFTYFRYTGQATISYAYTTTTTAAYGSTVTKYAFLQDNTGGISLKDNNKNLSTTYETGDLVSGIIGQIFNVNNTAQIYPYADFTVVSKGNSLTPASVTLTNIATKVNQLVQLNDIYFDGADGTKTFASNSSVFLRQGTAAVSTVPVRITSNLTTAPNFQGTIIPVTARNIVGVVSRIETSFTDYSVFVRQATDLDVQLSGLSNPTIKNMYIDGSSVVFETETIQKVMVYNSVGQLKISMMSQSGKNTISLQPGIYLIRIGQTGSKIVL